MQSKKSKLPVFYVFLRRQTIGNLVFLLCTGFRFALYGEQSRLELVGLDWDLSSYGPHPTASILGHSALPVSCLFLGPERASRGRPVGG